MYLSLLPHELFAHALWIEWQYHFMPPKTCKIKELLQRYNLKPKKGTADNDLSLIIGRALKDIGTHDSSIEISRTAQEVDRICVIARWDLVVARYWKQ